MVDAAVDALAGVTAVAVEGVEGMVGGETEAAVAEGFDMSFKMSDKFTRRLCDSRWMNAISRIALEVDGNGQQQRHEILHTSELAKERRCASV
jgi:hypothetical protein